MKKCKGRHSGATTEETLRALDTAHTKLAYHMENSPLAVVEWDSARGVIQWSKRAEALFGWSAEEVLGKRWEDLNLCHVDDKDRVDALTQKAYDRRELTFVCKNRNYTKKGDVIYTEWYNSLLPNEDDTVGSVLSLVLDVTERVRAEQALQEAQEHLRQSQKMEALGTLAGGIAHDFNNILGGIIGYIELALFSEELSPQTKGDIQQALSGSLRARELVRRILTFGKRNTMAFRFVHLGPIIQESLQLLRASIPSNISLQFEPLVISDGVFADSTAIHQVVMNLVSNASHAMPSGGGEILVRLENYQHVPSSLYSKRNVEAGDYLRIIVKDSGKGMPFDVQSRIFEPYFTTKEVGQGSGLGLAVVHGIVSSHQGYIFVESIPGKGSTFEVLIPNSQRIETEIIEAPVENFSITVKRKGRVLFVDDEEMLATVAKKFLEHIGYEVVTFPDCREALYAYQQNPSIFDIVVSDYTTPGMNGDELAMEIRKINAKIPFILCSGYGPLISSKIDPNKMPIASYLTKPFSLEQLAIAIDSAMVELP